jgi:hypothetical protein
MEKIKLEEIKVDLTLTPQTASQKGLSWVKDTIFSPSAPTLTQDLVNLVNQGYQLGKPSANNASKVLVGLYKKV